MSKGMAQMARKTYTETVAGKVKKYNDTRAGRKFFNSLVLLNDPKFLKRFPRWRAPLAFCIYCTKIDIEPIFPELHTEKIIPYEGSRELRQGVCRECKRNTSNMKK